MKNYPLAVVAAVLAAVGLTVEAAWAGAPVGAPAPLLAAGIPAATVGAPAPLLAAGIPAFLALGGGVLATKLIRRFRNRKE